jgi:hypothetical protein
MHKFYCFFILLFFYFTGISQTSLKNSFKDTVLLLNGNTIITTVIDTSKGVTVMVNPQKPEKRLMIDNDRIFSIKNDSGEVVLYVYDSLIGNEFTLDEMRYFMRGEQDAQKGFKAKGSFYGNMALSAAAGVTGSFLSPVVPFVFAALVGIPKIKIKHSTVSDLTFLKQDSYIMGYERVARKKRKLRSLFGGGIGLAVGLGTYGILKGTGNEIEY